MADTPNVRAPIWAASEASPWLMSAKRARIFDAFATRANIERRDLTAPPVSCNDGACFLVAGGATGAWAGLDGELVIAVGTNASSGWYAVPVAAEGFDLYIRAENIVIRFNGAAWITIGAGVSRLQDLTDVDLTGLADGYTLKWDASNGLFYPAPDIAAGGGTGTVTECIIIAASDETTALTTGDKVTIRMPYAFTLTGVKASLTTAQASGSIFTVDVKGAGTTLFSTKPTIDNTEKTTATAATPSVLTSSPTALADDEEVVVNVSQIGDGTAKGLKVVLIGHQ